MNFQRGTHQDEPEINLIPLIDVMLVILIFLMLTTTFSKIAGLQINLPSGEAEVSESSPDEITVVVSASGDIIVNGTPLANRDVTSIAGALGRATPASGRDPIVVINADAQATHQSVIDVMQAAQRAGLPQVTFAVQAPES